jgi:MocE subfamily Rieske [2Fe-2S] domain protein
MNPIHRYLYWNMNYHVEHHMFPLVPYHALPRLHELVKADMPRPYGSILEAWSELLPAVLRQRKDPAYHVKRKLPPPPSHGDNPVITAQGAPDENGWIEVCDEALLAREDVLRFDCGRKTFAIYRGATGRLFASDGICTHGNTHLAGGLVKGEVIECPKHNGRYHLADGSPARAPVCRGLCTYSVESRGGRLFINVHRAGGSGARAAKKFALRVVSNRNVATFIKELVFQLADERDKIAFTPGDYLQFDIPVYDEIRFRDFDVPPPYAAVWEAQHVFDLVARNTGPARRNNYSFASNPDTEIFFRFNIRIATPPPGQDCPPGAGSAYMFSLKPGDLVTAIGPYGDFHIKPTQKEMVYIGGGSGMAPLRSHISHLLESERSARRIGFWYGARSRQELFYQDYFEQLAAEHANFHFHAALSAPLPEDEWTGPCGMIHEVVLAQYLKSHEHPRAVEYYLCGPPLMIKACMIVLEELGVEPGQIAFDEF